jgi:hypothetical protein
MAAIFKYIKKAIVTITKGPRKGQKELRYFYKGDKLPGITAIKGAASKRPVMGAVSGQMSWKQINTVLMRMDLSPRRILDIRRAMAKGGQKSFSWKKIQPALQRNAVPPAQQANFMIKMKQVRGL